VFPARSPAVRPYVIAWVAVAEDLRELSDGVVLERLWGCYRQLPSTSGQDRNLLWDEILELQRELRNRYPPSTEPLT